VPAGRLVKEWRNEGIEETLVIAFMASFIPAFLLSSIEWFPAA
jgi:hypothetical protein